MSYILVPTFYCVDVENNIKTHGYKVAYYKTNKDLSSDKISFANAIKKYDPAVIIIFHPVGIENKLLGNKEILKTLNPETLLVEDSVHRIINPSVFQSLNYSLRVHILWITMLICLNLGFYKYAEKFMSKGYDLIGDAKKPARGLSLFKFIFKFINFDKIEKIKEHQVKIYEEHLPTTVKYEKSDRKNMRGYPLIINNQDASRVLAKLRNNNLLVRFEQIDCIWNKNQKNDLFTTRPIY